MDTLSDTGAVVHAHQQGDLQPAHHQGDANMAPWLDSSVVWQIKTGTGNNKTLQTGRKMKQLSQLLLNAQLQPLTSSQFRSETL